MASEHDAATKVAEGLSAVDASKLKHAKACLREAIALDPTCEHDKLAVALIHGKGADKEVVEIYAEAARQVGSVVLPLAAKLLHVNKCRVTVRLLEAAFAAGTLPTEDMGRALLLDANARQRGGLKDFWMFRIDPERASVAGRISVARWLIKARDRAGARPWAESAAREAPDDADALYVLGACLDREARREAWRRVWELDADVPLPDPDEDDDQWGPELGELVEELRERVDELADEVRRHDMAERLRHATYRVELRPSLDWVAGGGDPRVVARVHHGEYDSEVVVFASNVRRASSVPGVQDHAILDDLERIVLDASYR